MFPKTPIETKLDAEINSLLDKLKTTEKESKDYGTIVEQLSALHKLKNAEHEITVEDSQFSLPFGLKLPSLDTALLVGAHIFGILWITRYERENVITTKALGFIPKVPR